MSNISSFEQHLRLVILLLRSIVEAIHVLLSRERIALQITEPAHDIVVLLLEILISCRAT